MVVLLKRGLQRKGKNKRGKMKKQLELNMTNSGILSEGEMVSINRLGNISTLMYKINKIIKNQNEIIEILEKQNE